jgi:hypothetical protein
MERIGVGSQWDIGVTFEKAHYSGLARDIRRDMLLTNSFELDSRFNGSGTAWGEFSVPYTSLSVGGELTKFPDKNRYIHATYLGFGTYGTGVGAIGVSNTYEIYDFFKY